MNENEICVMAEKEVDAKDQQTDVCDNSQCHDEELDQLLTSALSDFDKPPPSRKTTVKETDDSKLLEDGTEAKWSGGIDLEGTEGISPDQLGSNFQKIAETAAKAISEESGDAGFTAAISQTRKNLSEGAENLQICVMAEKEVDAKDQQTDVCDNSQCHDEELDQLLTSALSDFDKPPPSRKTTVKETDDSKPLEDGTEAKWSDEFIKQAAVQFEQSIQSFLTQSGIDLEGTEGISPDQLGSNFQKIAETAAKAISEESGDAGFTAAISQTLKNLSEGAENLQTPFSEDEIMKMFGEMGLGDGAPSSDGLELMPFMQQMMQSLLSKEILYPALKDILDKYPEWLERNKEQLETTELDRYTKQKGLMKQVCAELEKESDTDSTEVKKQRFTVILDLMQKMQDCGHPPKDLVGDLGSIMTFDEHGNPQFPGLPTGTDFSQCVLM